MVTVGELAERTGVPPSTLRYYDRIGVLPAERSSSGYRTYDPDRASVALRAIALCQGLGLELPQIRTVLDAPDGPSPLRTDLARVQLARLDERLAELARARAVLEHLVDCRCAGTAECLAVLGAVIDGRDGAADESPPGAPAPAAAP